MKIISSEVRITPFTVAYAPEIFQLIDADRPHLSQYGDTTAKKYPDLESVIESVVNPSVTDKERFVILAGEQAVGSINTTPIDEAGTEHEVGYWVGGEQIGHGYAPMAVHSLAEMLRSRRTIDSLIAYAHPDNTPSQNVLLKSGFKKVPSPYSRLSYSTYQLTLHR